MDLQQIQDRTLFVQNLKDGINQEELYQVFISFGEIKNIEIPLTKEKKTRGLAFIEYEEVNDCQEAIQNLDQSELYGKVIVCKRPKRYKENRDIPVWEQADYNEKQDQQDQEKDIDIEQEKE